MRYFSLFAALSALLVTGCTWVEVTPLAQDVLVLNQARVANCDRLGSTDVSVAESVGFLNRVPEDIARDLENLARNQAVEMGGDTLSPLSQPRKGKQTFGVYNCIDDASTPNINKSNNGNNGVETIPYKG